MPLPSAPYPTEFVDLTPAQVAELKRIVLRCRRRIADAIGELGRAKEAYSPRVDAWFRIDSQDATAQRDLTMIIANYHRLVGALLGHERLRFNGEATGPFFNLGVIFGKRPPAYVRSLAPPDLGDAGQVKLVRNRFFEASEDDKVRIVLHEVGHRFLGLHDIKYLHGQPGRISRADAMRNADSYAGFALPMARSGSLSVPLSGH